MTDHFDILETRPREERERAFFARFVPFLTEALLAAPGLAEHLAGIEPTAVTDRAVLSRLPVLRKSRLMELQAKDPPFGGFVPKAALRGARVFMSPGPIWEPQGLDADPWHAARALHAAGFRPGDTVINCFGYQMTPGGFILDEGARALGCTVYPAGPGNTEAHAAAVAALKADGYLGTPDFLKVILEKADGTGADVSSLKRALVSGGALFPSLREAYAARGISVMQAYATADVGVIAYEGRTADGEVCPGMIVDESVLVEIVRPGTGDPVPDGEVGEVVVTTLNPAYPLVRFATGDLSAVMPDTSPCGRTNMRLKGWLGRADQRTKVKGMFVDPVQIAELLKRRPEVAKARLVVLRENERDRMILMVEASREGDIRSTEEIAAALTEITKLRGEVEEVAPGSLPNDGKVISDERKYD
ncbi:phenylacetate--CoA ligase family protein [Afifella sp. IM 167]|uniref:phenylacetate--CoA ligase family protein n=1 Tax=Afifella sp. IM 167 TaxID=2033586 RepID=UPI001CCFBD9F|nr:AMP-binding protein [Afifella sp. IM 167]MBZ8132741.1 AMP-dependent synthetase [Afifella sp. IM 167]